MRIKRLIGLILIILLGLVSRKLSFLPASIGDGLWAMVVYLAWRFLLPQARRSYLFILALCSSYLVEFSQLLTWPWLVHIRQTTLGHLLLGQGFLWSDLLAYLIGILLVLFIEQLLSRKN